MNGISRKDTKVVKLEKYSVSPVSIAQFSMEISLKSWTDVKLPPKKHIAQPTADLLYD